MNIYELNSRQVDEMCDERLDAMAAAQYDRYCKFCNRLIEDDDFVTVPLLDYDYHNDCFEEEKQDQEIKNILI